MFIVQIMRNIKTPLSLRVLWARICVWRKLSVWTKDIYMRFL